MVKYISVVLQKSMLEYSREQCGNEIQCEGMSIVNTQWKSMCGTRGGEIGRGGRREEKGGRREEGAF